MNFSFTEDQVLIADTAAAVLAEISDSAAVRKTMQSTTGFDDAVWQRISRELAWPMTLIPETYGGLGLGYVEHGLLLEKAGEYLLCAPLFSSSWLATSALLVAGQPEQKARYLPKLAAGEQRMSLAYASAGRSAGLEAVTARYTTQAEKHVLNGQYAYVPDGHSADTLIVACRNAAQPEQVALFLVDSHAMGVSIRPTPGLDQTRKLASVELNDVSVVADAQLSGVSTANQALQSILALAAIGIAAEQLGVAERCLNMTVDYISERKQFGRVVGSFQAMKHKAADMMLKAEAARSAAYYAFCVADEFSSGGQFASELQEASSIAKSYCCDAAFFNAGCALQMHGGVGFTWEYDVHLYFKRAKAAQLSFADSDWHREYLAGVALGEH